MHLILTATKVNLDGIKIFFISKDAWYAVLAMVIPADIYFAQLWQLRNTPFGTGPRLWRGPLAGRGVSSLSDRTRSAGFRPERDGGSEIACLARVPAFGEAP